MTEVAIVGAGLAGLACGRELTSRGLSCVLLEASDGVGGRARTDLVDGFQLDRGFQVLLTAYPEAQRVLDYPSLQLRPFEPGALVRYQGRFHRIADPWRRPSAALGTLVSPVGTLGDKLKLGSLRHKLTSADSAPRFPETSTLECLSDFGFSPAILERFFRPFLGGIFLERELATSSRMLEFVFRMFSLGEAALPAIGMGAMAAQLASHLPKDSIRLRQKAVRVAPGCVTLASGEEVRARAVVVATDHGTAAQLLPGMRRLSSSGTTCFYFAADRAPVSEPVLVLNGDGVSPGTNGGLINHLCVPSVVAPSYAPSGKHLVSANVIGQAAAPPVEEIRSQLVGWFGPNAKSWRHLRTDWIPDALPEQTPVSGGIRHESGLIQSGLIQSGQTQAGLYVCGDHCESASINGALASGRFTAEAIAAEVAKTPGGTKTLS